METMETFTDDQYRSIIAAVRAEAENDRECGFQNMARDMDDAGDALEILLQHRDENEADARRYRFLRDEHVRCWTSNMGAPDSLDINFEAQGHDLDAAIDLAMAGAS